MSWQLDEKGGELFLDPRSSSRGGCGRSCGGRSEQPGVPEASMATWQRGSGCWERSPPEPRPRAGPRGPRAEEEAASPAVLSLSHFCRSPFLCFGDVRLGASRTLPLILDNPNEEAAAVWLSRGPAAERGFTIWPSAFVLQVGAGCGLPAALRDPGSEGAGADLSKSRVIPSDSGEPLSPGQEEPGGRGPGSDSARARAGHPSEHIPAFCDREEFLIDLGPREDWQF